MTGIASRDGLFARLATAARSIWHRFVPTPATLHLDVDAAADGKAITVTAAIQTKEGLTPLSSFPGQAVIRVGRRKYRLPSDAIREAKRVEARGARQGDGPIEVRGEEVPAFLLQAKGDPMFRLSPKAASIVVEDRAPARRLHAELEPRGPLIVKGEAVHPGTGSPLTKGKDKGDWVKYEEGWFRKPRPSPTVPEAHEASDFHIQLTEDRIPEFLTMVQRKETDEEVALGPVAEAARIIEAPVTQEVRLDLREEGLIVEKGYAAGGVVIPAHVMELDPEGRAFARVDDDFVRRDPEAVRAGIELAGKAGIPAGTDSTTLTGDAIPDYLLKCLPEVSKHGDVLMTPRTARAHVFDRPPKPTLKVDIEGDKVTAEVQLEGGDEFWTEEEYKRAAGKQRFARKGDTWIPAVPAHVEEIDRRLSLGQMKRTPGGKHEAGGDSAPEFLTKRLPELAKVWNVYHSKRVEGARVVEDALQPKVSVDIPGGGRWLEFSFEYLSGKKDLPATSVEPAVLNGRKYLHEGTSWHRIDSDAVGRVKRVLTTLAPQDLGKGKYRVPLEQHQEALSLFTTLGSIEHSEAYRQFLHRLSAFTAIETVDVPAALRGQLREYQKLGYYWLCFLRQYGLNGALCDDMGLGKTIQAIALMLKAKEDGILAPNLIVCPTSVIDNWLAEIRKFSGSTLRTGVYHGSGRRSVLKNALAYDVLLTSYGTVRRDAVELGDVRWRYVILDEAHRIRNRDSQQSKACRQLKANHKLALTGTPVQNSPADLWTLFDFLMPDYLGAYPAFQRKYEVPIAKNQDMEALAALRQRIKPFCIRRTKQEVSKELRALTPVEQYCELTSKQKAMYIAVAGDAASKVRSGDWDPKDKQSKLHILAAITRLRQICCHPALVTKKVENLGGDSGKLAALEDMLQDALADGHRILLFSQFTSMLDLMEQWLGKLDGDLGGLQWLRLDGGTLNRQQMVDEFNGNKDIPLFLISLGAGGEGLNLQGADYVFHYDLHWNPAVMAQADGRAHRIGQEKPVFSYRMVTRGTIEERMLSLLQQKASVAQDLVPSDENVLKKISREELLSLFDTTRLKGGPRPGEAAQ